VLALRRVLFILMGAALLLDSSRSGLVAVAQVASRDRRPASGLAIVVNKTNPVENLSLGDLRKIFMGQKSGWPHGTRIAVLMMDSGPERETMLREVYRMSEREYRNHFLRGLFAEDVRVVPRTLANPVVMRKFVFNAPGAIGYVLPRDIDPSVKVIRIDGLLPEDKDYKLQVDARLSE
jgi:hypothetical protein